KKDPDALDRSSLLGNQSALDRFTSQLESRVLGDLLNGVKDGKTGMVTTDDFVVRVYNGDAGMLIVEIKDRLTGEISEIIVGQN
ncbi:curli assembly protein CsgF, partial [Leclercia adecarboxylata]